jgi:hypothetical protein
MLSARGACLDCGERLRTENFMAMKLHTGPAFDHWRARTLAAFGITLVDDTDHAR